MCLLSSIYVFFILFLDTDNSLIRESDGSKPVLNSQTDTGGTDIDDSVQKANENVMLGDGPESDHSSEQISRSTETVQQVAVTEKIDQESKQLAGVSVQTFMIENKTIAAGSSLVESGKEPSVANSGHTVSGSNERTSVQVII